MKLNIVFLFIFCVVCVAKKEFLFFTGTPDQQSVITSPECGLICRQLLFSAANGSMHGPAAEAKAHQLITMCEDFFKYQQGFFSRAFISTTLEVINGILDSSAFHKVMGGAKRYGRVCIFSFTLSHFGSLLRQYSDDCVAFSLMQCEHSGVRHSIVLTFRLVCYAEYSKNTPLQNLLK
jgi:hypothetical protein